MSTRSAEPTMSLTLHCLPTHCSSTSAEVTAAQGLSLSFQTSVRSWLGLYLLQSCFPKIQSSPRKARKHRVCRFSLKALTRVGWAQPAWRPSFGTACQRLGFRMSQGTLLKFFRTDVSTKTSKLCSKAMLRGWGCSSVVQDSHLA